VHFIVKARGYDTLITHLFVPDCPFLPEDTGFGAKDSLIAHFVKVDDANQAAAAGLPSPFWSVKWDFVPNKRGKPNLPQFTAATTVSCRVNGRARTAAAVMLKRLQSDLCL
jgi:catechol 1,2-dioxygenase